MSGKVRTKIFFFSFSPSQQIKFHERIIIFFPKSKKAKSLCKGRKLNASGEKGWGSFVSFGTSKWAGLVKFKGSTAITPMRHCKRDFLVERGALSCVLRQKPNRGRDKSSSPPTCSLCSTTPQCICVLAATRCKANKWLFTLHWSVSAEKSL